MERVYSQFIQNNRPEPYACRRRPRCRGWPGSCTWTSLWGRRRPAASPPSGRRHCCTHITKIDSQEHSRYNKTMNKVH